MDKKNSLTSYTLNNHIECFIKDLPSATSVTIGLFLDVSLEKEPHLYGGISHFLEHMCFRGTKKRSAYDITKEIDSLGGYINACTSKEYTQYYVTTLPDNVDNGIDILTDAVFNSLLKNKDIELEKSIISEEIKMVEDTPDEKIHDVFNNQLFKSSYLGKPILGTIDSISTFSSDILHNYYINYFIPSNIKIVIAGHIENHNRLINQLNQSFSTISLSKAKQNTIPIKESFTSNTHHIEKDLEQFHLCLGFPGIFHNDPSRFTLTTLSTILGGSMSSRLFQSVREKKGLAYSIYSHASFFKQSGSLSIYAGTSIETANDTIACIKEELNKCLEKGITKEEFKRSKQQLKGNIIINLESSSAWVSWLGRQLIYDTGLTNINQLKEKIDSVTIESINTIAKKLLDDTKQITVSIGKKSLNN